MTSAEDRRHKTRLDVRVNATMVLSYPSSPQPYIFIAENISEGGAFIRGERESYPFEQAESLDSWLYPFPSYQSHIFFKAKVVHKRDGGLGLNILHIEAPEMAKLRAYIQFYWAMHPENRV